MIILLIVIGFVLILISFIPIRKQDNSFNNILKEQDNLDKDYDIELMAIRKDMAESILELQEEIEELRNNIKHINNTVNSNKDQDNTTDMIEESKGYDSVICDIDFNNSKSEDKNTKTDIIRKMIKDGYSDDDICEELKVGKGEVLLIRGLYK